MVNYNTIEVVVGPSGTMRGFGLERNGRIEEDQE
jgi:hypothetical protein